MNSASLLGRDDHCQREAFWGQTWERNRMRFNDILRRSVEESLVQPTDDPAQYAGDTFMTYCSLRSMDVKVNDLYSVGIHGASLSDLITTLLRGQSAPWGHPEDVTLGEQVWTSSAYLEPNGVRLRGVLIANSASDGRLEAAKHSWEVWGEVCAYQMPMTLTVVILGASRDGRCHGPLSKGWLHTVGTQNLRFRRRDGSGLSGAGWRTVFREEVDHIDREKWVQCMKADGVLEHVLFDVEVTPPPKEISKKVRRLAEKKLARLLGTKAKPDAQPSVCDLPYPCQFHSVCWGFAKEPREPEFVRLR